MKENLKKYLFPIICVIVVIVTFVMLFDLQKKADEMNVNNSNVVNTENTVDNTASNTVANEVEGENTVTNEATQNTTTSNKVVDEGDPVTSDENDKYAENKQSQAIELVKQHWGSDTKVKFSNESVTSEGEYIVSVRDKSTTEVLNYFKVNIETGKVEIYY